MKPTTQHTKSKEDSTISGVDNHISREITTKFDKRRRKHHKWLLWCHHRWRFWIQDGGSMRSSVMAISTECVNCYSFDVKRVTVNPLVDIKRVIIYPLGLKHPYSMCIDSLQPHLLYVKWTRCICSEWTSILELSLNFFVHLLPFL